MTNRTEQQQLNELLCENIELRNKIKYLKVRIEELRRLRRAAIQTWAGPPVADLEYDDLPER